MYIKTVFKVFTYIKTVFKVFTYIKIVFKVFTYIKKKFLNKINFFLIEKVPYKTKLIMMEYINFHIL